MFKKILYPVDLRDLQAEKVQRILPYVQFFKAEIHFLYVQNWLMSPYPDEALLLGVGSVGLNQMVEVSYDEFTQELLRKVPELKEYSCTFCLEMGVLADSVAQYARDKQIDLIITEHNHQGGIAHWFLRSGDEEILDKVDIPVLVLPC